jgi:hypothetical protein
MGLSTKQALFKCCGFYCAMLACIGVYFYLVMAYFQSVGNNFLIMELEEFQDAAASNYE